ncbi:MAG TPA: hypothetical protein VN669_00240 [Candidatus Acidoferrales bacterium]|jgi:hypothetical protein|nr:hypothetical protein [Candidatus Acidoferrales bacterium]
MNGLWLAVVATCMAAAPLSHFSQSDVPPDWNIPRPVWERLDKEKLLSTYEISTKLNPFYLRGDFDGDGKPDYAVLITNRATKILGIAILRSRAQHVDILGAGGIRLRRAPTADGSPAMLIDNFGWVDAWHVVPKEPLKPTGWDKPVSPMVGEGIEVEKTEASSALIYYDGESYRWLQDSD